MLVMLGHMRIRMQMANATAVAQEFTSPCFQGSLETAVARAVALPVVQASAATL
jgi:hypothetical protein